MKTNLKITILTIVWVLLIHTFAVHAATQVQFSEDNATWQNVTNLNSNKQKASQLSLQPQTLYYFRGRNDTSNWTYVPQRTKAGGEPLVAGLAITIFILIITFTVLCLPWIIKQFSDNYYLDATLKGLCIVIGLFLLSLDTAMVATIAETAGIPLTQELFTYLWIISRAAYIAMVAVILMFLFRMLQHWQVKKQQRSFGEDM